MLRDGERPVGDLVDQLRLSQPAVSKHLRVLKEAGFVEVRQLWTSRLDQLEEHLDRRKKS